MADSSPKYLVVALAGELNHPTGIAQGYTPVIHAHTVTMAVTFTELIAKMDPRTGQTIEDLSW